jgi:hypothetical protein
VNKNRAQAGELKTASRTSTQDKSLRKRGGQRPARDQMTKKELASALGR